MFLWVDNNRFTDLHVLACGLTTTDLQIYMLPQPVAANNIDTSRIHPNSCQRSALLNLVMTDLLGIVLKLVSIEDQKRDAFLAAV